MTDRLSPVLFEIKRASVTDTGYFEGYASTWGGPPDLHGDIIERGAFAPALAMHKASDTQPAMLWGHDLKEPIGKWLTFTEDNYGLLATGKLTLGTKRGAEAHALLRDDAIALSIGFSLGTNGAQTKNGIRYLTKIARLGEVSLVALPANSKAKVKSEGKPNTVREFQKAMRGIGFSSRESKFVTTHGFRDLHAPGERSQIDLLNEKIDLLLQTLEVKL